MKKILIINSVCGVGSTGKISTKIHQLVNEEPDFQSKIIYFWGEKNENGKKLSSLVYQKYQALRSRVLGNYGKGAIINTLRAIAEIEKYDPQIVHLHNVHDHTVNVVMLLKHLKKRKVKVVWTFHDCWAFTGYCTHFSYEKCDKWITECHNCPLRKQYSWFFDRSSELYLQKKDAIKDMDITVVTPSIWLENIVRRSFFKTKDILTIYNGIDLNVFRPTKSYFREKNNIENKILLLGVAFGWSYKKGLDIFIELAKILDERFAIVLVGTDREIDKMLPARIISIHRTNSKSELAEIYSSANFFVNPTREEVFGLVNTEALACGTPVIMFNTGGAPEAINEHCGRVTKCNDVSNLVAEIYNQVEKCELYKDECIRYAQKFDEEKQMKEYIQLYRDILQKGRQ